MAKISQPASALHPATAAARQSDAEWQLSPTLVLIAFAGSPVHAVWHDHPALLGKLLQIPGGGGGGGGGGQYEVPQNAACEHCVLVSVAHGHVAMLLATNRAFIFSNAVANAGAVASRVLSYLQKVPAATAERGQMQFEVEFENVASIVGL